MKIISDKEYSGLVEARLKEHDMLTAALKEIDGLKSEIERLGGEKKRRAEIIFFTAISGKKMASVELEEWALAAVRASKVLDSGKPLDKPCLAR